MPEKEQLRSEYRDFTSETQIIPEDEYFDFCVNHALEGGWVKKEEKEILIKNYLKPIYQEYLKVIEEVKTELEKEENSEKRTELLMKRLNLCLFITRRIGSTAPGNILRTINDDIKFSRDEWIRYALEAMEEKIREIFLKN